MQSFCVPQQDLHGLVGNPRVLQGSGQTLQRIAVAFWIVCSQCWVQHVWKMLDFRRKSRRGEEAQRMMSLAGY